MATKTSMPKTHPLQHPWGSESLRNSCQCDHIDPFHFPWYAGTEEKPEHEGVCKLLNRIWNSFKCVSFFKREIEYLRWADYTMIATATVCLTRALREENPKLLMAASALTQVAFAKRALKDPDLKMAHDVHKMSSLLGGALFIADDLFPETPFLHAGWHLAAAIGVGTCNKLLQ